MSFDLRQQVSQQFSTRIRDLQYWSTNLESKTSEVGTEIDALLQCQAQLQRMHHACGGPSLFIWPICSINFDET
jgi:CRP-like cAMP-binding protein